MWRHETSYPLSANVILSPSSFTCNVFYGRPPMDGEGWQLASQRTYAAVVSRRYRAAAPNCDIRCLASLQAGLQFQVTFLSLFHKQLLFVYSEYIEHWSYEVCLSVDTVVDSTRMHKLSFPNDWKILLLAIRSLVVAVGFKNYYPLVYNFWCEILSLFICLSRLEL